MSCLEFELYIKGHESALCNKHTYAPSLHTFAFSKCICATLRPKIELVLLPELPQSVQFDHLLHSMSMKPQFIQSNLIIYIELYIVVTDSHYRFSGFPL